MNFNQKYGRQPAPFEPSQEPEYNPEPDIIWSGRIFPCDVCGAPTGWRFCYTDQPGVPCCSEACKAVKYVANSIIEEAETVPILPQPPEIPSVSPAVEAAPATATEAEAVPVPEASASSPLQ